MAHRYRDLLDGYVLDHADAESAGALSIPVTTTRVLMLTPADQDTLARDVLAAADALIKAAA